MIDKITPTISVHQENKVHKENKVAQGNKSFT